MIPSPIDRGLRRVVGAVLLLAAAGCAPALHVRPFAVPPTPGPPPAAPVAGMEEPAVDEDLPLDVRSDSMEYRQEGRVTVFRGHVVVVQGKARILAPYLEVRPDEGLALAKQGVSVLDGAHGLTLTAHEVDYLKNLSHIRARGEVRLDSQDDQGKPIQVRSRALEWNTLERKVTAEGDVRVWYNGITATAQAMIYDEQDLTITLAREDSKDPIWPRVIRNQDVITGETIVIDARQRSYRVLGGAQAVIAPRRQEEHP